jgi:hypothetical protein
MQESDRFGCSRLDQWRGWSVSGRDGLL